MNKKGNIRARQTNEKIRLTFCHLLETLPIEKITVRMLCDEAKINRTTFYSYYLDLDDLLERTEDDLTAELLQHVRAAAADLSDRDRYLMPYLRFLYDHKAFFKAYFLNSQLSGYKKDLRMILRASVRQCIDVSTLSERAASYCLDYYESGVFALMKNWAQSDFLDTPEQMASLIRICVRSDHFKRTAQ